MVDSGAGQWDADTRLDISDARRMPVMMLRATLLLDDKGRVTTFLGEPYQ